MKNIFVIEGIDGAGKSSILLEIQSYLIQKKVSFKTFREPGGTELGENIRNLITSIKEYDSYSMLARFHLTLASRCLLVEAIQKEDCDIIILDRFFYSTYAYQGYGYGIDISLIDTSHKHILKDLKINKTFVLDIDPASEDYTKRGKLLNEEKIEFLQRVRQGYLELAKKFKEIKIIDATRQKAQILSTIVKEIEKVC